MAKPDFAKESSEEVPVTALAVAVMVQQGVLVLVGVLVLAELGVLAVGLRVVAGLQVPVVGVILEWQHCGKTYQV